MQGKTHRVGGCVAALVAFEVMRSKGWLLPNVNDFVQLAMMYPICSWASIASDLDHGPDSIPDKDPVSILINKLLHIVGAKHRSWQTHSILVTGGFCAVLFALTYLFNSLFGIQDNIGWAYIRLTVIGFIMGITSHLFLDMLTTQGIHIIPGVKFRFVPKSSVFATGGKWELFVRKVLIIIIVLLVMKILLGTLGIDIFKLIR